MLRICIPVHNEATTIGVLLWRLRAVFQGFSREYDVVVYDDASTDGTAEVLEPYRSVMPLTVLRSGTHRGYAGSIDALVRHVAAEDDYARRDAMVLLQGDFTESPEHLPELVKRFEGGADLVAVHRTVSDATPQDERRLRRWGRWAVKPFLRLPPVADPFTGFRLVRISVLRDLLKAMGDRPVCAGEGWAANIDFALNVTPFARRIENVEFAPRYDVRQRASRRRGWPDVVALFHWARAARRTVRPTPGARLPDAPRTERAAEPALVSAPLERGQRAAPSERERDRNERTERRPRPERGQRTAGRDAAEPAAPAAPAREERLPREARGAREERALRGEDRPARGEERTRGKPERPPREPRPPRPERPPQDRATERGPRPPIAQPEPVPADAPMVDEEFLLDASATAELGGDAADAGDITAESADGTGVKKARRRRRRSRRSRGEKPGEGEGGDDEVSSSGDDAGTSDDGEGQDDDGGDAADDGGSDVAGADGSSEGGRRKRRPRRRRRGRRPGGAEGGDAADAPPPPAAEPPAA